MNSFMDYVCRGIIRSEDAIRHLNKRVVKLAKCNNQLATAVICLGVAGLGMTAVLWIQENEIKALQNKVDELAKDVEDYADCVASAMEENQQEGA